MSLFTSIVVQQCASVFSELASLSEELRIEAINAIRLELQKYSPLANEPVDCVLWVKADEVRANDYNPNSVAPPEMKLLAHSVAEDGYTQPIVTWKTEGVYEVVDGYHRNRVGREIPAIRERLKGYLPITVVNSARTDRGDRIAATIRHNRARGKHRIDAMSEIVVELRRRNWSNEKIGRELGMDPDEVLRLTQITGLAEMFADREFSKAWEAEESTEINETDRLETHEENPLPLPDVGGLAERDVPGDTLSDPASGNRRRSKGAKNAKRATDGDAKGRKGVAGKRGRKPIEPESKPPSVAGSGSLLPDDDDAGLPDETRLAQPQQKAAGRRKRRGRFDH
jgi:ParB-like chromosome segregation protein Spo0J